MTVILFDQLARERIAIELGPEMLAVEAHIHVFGSPGLEEGTVEDLVKVDGAETHPRDELVIEVASACVHAAVA